jgi:hypothetical protein
LNAEANEMNDGHAKLHQASVRAPKKKEDGTGAKASAAAAGRREKFNY